MTSTHIFPRSSTFHPRFQYFSFPFSFSFACKVIVFIANFSLFSVLLYEILHFMYEIAAYWKFPNAACKGNVNFADFQIVARLAEQFKFVYNLQKNIKQHYDFSKKFLEISRKFNIAPAIVLGA